MISKGKGEAVLFFGYDKLDDELYTRVTEGEIYETCVEGKLIYVIVHRQYKQNGELYKNKWALSEIETGMQLATKNQGCCNKKSKRLALESFVHFIDKIKLCNFWIGIGRGHGMLMQIDEFPLNDISGWNK